MCTLRCMCAGHMQLRSWQTSREVQTKMTSRLGRCQDGSHNPQHSNNMSLTIMHQLPD